MSAADAPPVDGTFLWQRPVFYHVAVLALCLVAFDFATFALREVWRLPEILPSDIIVFVASGLASATGFVLSMWLIFPVVGYLKIAELVPRAVVAVGIASVLVWLATFFALWAVNSPDYYSDFPLSYLLQSGASGISEILARLPLYFLAALALRELDWRRHDTQADRPQVGVLHGQA